MSGMEARGSTGPEPQWTEAARVQVAALLSPAEIRAIEADLAAHGLVGQPSYAAWWRAAVERAALRRGCAAARPVCVTRSLAIS